MANDCTIPGCLIDQGQMSMRDQDHMHINCVVVLLCDILSVGMRQYTEVFPEYAYIMTNSSHIRYKRFCLALKLQKQVEIIQHHVNAAGVKKPGYTR